MLRTVLLAVGATAAVAVVSAPQAAAQPDLTSRGWEYTSTYGPTICQTIDANPTVDGFGETLERVAVDGFSAYEASGIMIAALSTYCPRNYWLVDAFIKTVPPAPSAPNLL